jgi:transketolase
MSIEDLSINTIRFLSADAVEQAKSGHPGTPMGAAPIIYVLWKQFLRHNPAHPEWVNRDRFILSSGHASMLLYSVLYLTGYGLSLDDIKEFRQLGSRTPGHPELHITPGVEMTTGPLGQGFASAVGIAIAEAHLNAQFNKLDLNPIIDHFTYVLASDGDLMEGVSSEAASLAGHLGLGKLIVLYDDNRVSIEGPTDISFTEDRLARFAAYDWHTQAVEDVNNLHDIEFAIQQARDDATHPSIIAIRSLIGYGAPNKQGKSISHAGALGEQELLGAKENLGWPKNERFFVPDEVLDHFRAALDEGERHWIDWNNNFEDYTARYPQDAAEFERIMRGDLPVGWEAHLPNFEANPIGEATRFATGHILKALAPVIPELIGGSADVATATMTVIENSKDFGPGNYSERNLRFGVREHAMCSILNGIALHGGLIPYGATFLTFYDYMRPAVRLAALMKIHTIILFSHDSIGLGEDGPTHQPVEHLFGLRSVPNLTLIRPCDLNEASEAWCMALKIRNGPICIALSRQALPILDRNHYSPASGLRNGAYIISEADGGEPSIILIATGSEVHLALKAQSSLQEKGVSTRVVSMPSWEIFQKQSKEYQETILPPSIKARVAIEAGSTLGWERWIGLEGAIIGLDQFGASAPCDQVFENFGFTVKGVVEASLSILEINRQEVDV